MPLLRRADLVAQRVECQGGEYFVIKDPVTLKYFRLDPEHYHVLGLLDGRRSLDAIRDDLHIAFPYARPTLPELQSVVVDLHEKGLLASNRPGQGNVFIEKRDALLKKKIFGVFQNILSLRLPGWDPERTLKLLYPIVGWLYHPAAIAIQVAMIAASWVLLSINFDHFRRLLPEFQQFFGWPNLLWLYLTLACTKILHELGHGLTCRHFGGECHEIGVIVLVFSPTLYCEVSDSWMLPNKWHRIAIGAAGMWVESVLAAFALFAWWFSTPGLFHHLCLNIFFVSTITTVIFNLNPLMRYDGYYMLSDFLEIPNLSEKANTLLRNTFAKVCLGVETREDPFMPQRGRHWFVLYSVASAIYRWVVLFGITLFLYTVLKPYKLQSIGVALAWFSMAGIVGNLGYTLYRLMATPRSEPLSRNRIGATLLVVAALVAGLLAIPLPWHVEAPFYVEPLDVVYVQTSVPGSIETIHVKAGDTVEEGDPLIDLVDPEKVLKLQELQTQLSTQKLEVQKQEAIGNHTAIVVAERQRDSIEEQIAEFNQQIEMLKLKAPVAGVVVSMPRVEEPPGGVESLDLHGWHGSPLDKVNVGAALEPRTPVMCIAPDSNYQVILLVDQQDRGDLSVGTEVEIRFDQLPGEIWSGKVSKISPRHADFAPPSLTNKTGGDLTTVSDRQGRERLSSSAYEAVVVIDENTDRLRAGLRGRTRFSVGHRSSWQLIFRWLRHTFHFKI
ncbi:MAG: efflux RND transporter periplasmic adaptor subunit [Planctomycetota bacterium]|nr:efflux RND transporter periplasmic adaptor subunit [Planctomycetota bacterium]